MGGGVTHPKPGHGARRQKAPVKVAEPTAPSLSLPLTLGCRGGLSSLPPGYSVCVGACAQLRRNALPAAFATSAAVTFWTLALTLKVTAGPTILQEIIQRDVQGQLSTQCRPCKCVHSTDDMHTTHPTCDFDTVTLSPFPSKSTENTRRCSYKNPHQANPQNNAQTLLQGKTVLWKGISVSGSQRSRMNQKQKGKRLVFFKS